MTWITHQNGTPCTLLRPMSTQPGVNQALHMALGDGNSPAKMRKAKTCGRQSVLNGTILVNKKPQHYRTEATPQP